GDPGTGGGGGSGTGGGSEPDNTPPPLTPEQNAQKKHLYLEDVTGLAEMDMSVADEPGNSVTNTTVSEFCDICAEDKKQQENYLDSIDPGTPRFGSSGYDWTGEIAFDVTALVAGTVAVYNGAAIAAAAEVDALGTTVSSFAPRAAAVVATMASKAWGWVEDLFSKGESEIEQAVTKGTGEGQNIVGTTHNEIRPTQDYVNPEKVDEYANKLSNGEPVEPIEVYDAPDGGRYISEGHHRYVASQETGIPVEMNVKEGGGPIGHPDWSEVQWKEYVNEDQFWGD
ncbi:ParB-like nuclease domain-containing protein, partial [Paenibacillus sp. yr247]|uniref:ParB N-terminal domain-containing protein n=1 Tax=Paenibacillus sp. yr247 TaxID=1761880 RepID=UPI00089114F2